jgi:hypothetical protein
MQGVFIMEYCDFLDVFEVVERTQLFDTSWVQSTHWLNVRSRQRLAVRRRLP